MSESNPIPSVRLDNTEIWDTILPRLRDMVLTGRFILGPELEEFEADAADFFDTDWCVGTSSGTSALVLALRASGLPEGSRVALPANTFFATFEAVLWAGHVPVLVDHDEHYLIDLAQLESLDEIDAVIPVHLFGLPVDMHQVMRLAEARGWFVLEDASQAHGASIDGRPVGSFGHASAFSCYPTKNLGAWGDAGFVCGNDPDIEARVRALRHHGQAVTNVHSEISSTERLDNLQALVLTEKLKRLDDEISQRRAVAESYHSSFANSDLSCPGDIDGRLHVYHQFVVEVPGRDKIRDVLSAQGIGTGVHYPTPIHLQPGAASKFEQAGPLDRSEHSRARILSLPMSPNMSSDEITRVAEGLTSAMYEAQDE